MARLQGVPTNLNAFLDMIGVSEGTSTVADSDDGYNVVVGGTLFEGYDDHPRQKVFIPKYSIYSTAAGRYQILEHYFDAYKSRLDLPDFSPESQDKIALQLIRECNATSLIASGKIQNAILACSSRWASFEGSLAGQHTNSVASLLEAYKNAGGELCQS